MLPLLRLIIQITIVDDSNKGGYCGAHRGVDWFLVDAIDAELEIKA